MNFWRFQQTHTFFRPAFLLPDLKKNEKRSIHLLGASSLTINYNLSKTARAWFCRISIYLGEYQARTKLSRYDMTIVGSVYGEKYYSGDGKHLSCCDFIYFVVLDLPDGVGIPSHFTCYSMANRLLIIFTFEKSVLTKTTKRKLNFSVKRCCFVQSGNIALKILTYMTR